jgi:hypothetical protein
LDLSELIALISVCSIFISNSTDRFTLQPHWVNTIGFYPNLLACSAKGGALYEKKTIFAPDKHVQTAAGNSAAAKTV